MSEGSKRLRVTVEMVVVVADETPASTVDAQMHELVNLFETTDVAPDVLDVIWCCVKVESRAKTVPGDG